MCARPHFFALVLTAGLVLPAVTLGQDQIPTREAVGRTLAKVEFSPYAGRVYPTNVYWGDTHLHTSVSVDAGTMCRLGQEDALRFARGEEVLSTHGLRAKLSRPLDFIVVADHAEMYGLMPQLLQGDPEILSTEKGKRWYDMLTTGDIDQVFAAAMEIIASLQQDEPPFQSTKLVRDAWRNYTALADEYNEPGRFTALIGYEWTAIGGYNLHRNVIFRGDSSVANRTVPFSQFDSKNPEDLWEALAAFEGETRRRGADHPPQRQSQQRQDVHRGDLCRRASHPGRCRDAHPFLSPDDEFADYETWDRSNLDGTEVKKDEMLRWEYSREALKTGLMIENDLGVNPYKFGMIGSTDAHTALAAVGEDNFFGKHSGVGLRGRLGARKHS